MSHYSLNQPLPTVFGQSFQHEFGMTLPLGDSVIPMSVPGVIISEDHSLVKIDLNVALMAFPSMEGISVDYQADVMRNETSVCSRYIKLSLKQGKVKAQSEAEKDLYILPLSVSYVDTADAGNHIYSVKLTPSDHHETVTRLQHIDLVITVIGPEPTKALYKTVLVPNSETPSLFICSPTPAFDRLIHTGSPITDGVWLPDGTAFYGYNQDCDSGLIRVDASTSHVQSARNIPKIEQLLVSPLGDMLYIVDRFRVLQMNTSTFQFLRYNVPVSAVVLHPDGTALYASFRQKNGVDSIHVIDTDTMTKKREIPFPYVSELALTDDGSILVGLGSSRMHLIHIETGEVRSVGEVKDPFAMWMTLSSRFNLALVADSWGVTPLQIKEAKLLPRIPMEYSLTGKMLVDDSRGLLYVLQRQERYGGAGAVSVVDLSTLTLLHTASLEPLYATSLALDPGGTHIWVSMVDRVCLLDPDTLEIQSVIPTGMFPTGIFFQP